MIPSTPITKFYNIFQLRLQPRRRTRSSPSSSTSTATKVWPSQRCTGQSATLIITFTLFVAHHVGHAHKIRVKEQSRQRYVSRSTRHTSLLQLGPRQGLAFHPTQPLLAAALHNGSVQLWNYRMGVLVDRFEEHEGTLLLIYMNLRR